jgi:hypothetical protein
MIGEPERERTKTFPLAQTRPDQKNMEKFFNKKLGESNYSQEESPGRWAAVPGSCCSPRDLPDGLLLIKELLVEVFPSQRR